ncbi:hypothetical protein M513_06503, partial [Trichuris suis]
GKSGTTRAGRRPGTKRGTRKGTKDFPTKRRRSYQPGSPKRGKVLSTYVEPGIRHVEEDRNQSEDEGL